MPSDPKASSPGCNDPIVRVRVCSGPMVPVPVRSNAKASSRAWNGPIAPVQAPSNAKDSVRAPSSRIALVRERSGPIGVQATVRADRDVARVSMCAFAAAVRSGSAVGGWW